MGFKIKITKKNKKYYVVGASLAIIVSLFVILKGLTTGNFDFRSWARGDECRKTSDCDSPYYKCSRGLCVPVKKDPSESGPSYGFPGNAPVPE